MKKKVYRIFLVCVLLVYMSDIAYALTAKEIVHASEKAVRGNTQIALMEMTIKTRRWTRTLKIKSWEKRKEKKSFSEILAPQKDAGNRFLLIKRTMWHYVPKLQKTIKISPSMMLQSWMGSDFTNDDIVKESSMVEDYTHNLLGKETVNGYESYKIQLDPKADAAVIWGKIIYYARVSDMLPVRKEYYNEHNVLKKVLIFSNFKRMHDRVIPTRYKMQTSGKDDRFTILEIKKALFNVRIPSKVFSLQNLQRR